MSDTQKRPQFGNRFLNDDCRVFEHNAWDNVVWDEEQEDEAKRKVDENSKDLIDLPTQEKYEENAAMFWDGFYTQHQNKFFKDRHWLFTEFPELLSEKSGDNCLIPERVLPPKEDINYPTNVDKLSEEVHHENNDVVDSEPIKDWTETELKSKSEVSTAQKDEIYPGQNSDIRMLEVGCGVGNTVFPVLQTNNNPKLFMYCCDLSETAISLVKDHKDYNPDRCHAFVCDVTSPHAEMPFPKESLDIIILIFVLSAVHPNKMQETIFRISQFLKPGGKIVFRDYGRYDLAQLRFKNGRCLSENFYVRGDGTRVYFFTSEELDIMFSKAGLKKEQNLIDRRLQVNRGRQLKMYRVWIQCKYSKIAD